MTDTLFDLCLEISMYVSELHDLTRTIKELDDTLIKEDTEANRLFMSEAIDRYKIVCDKLKILLEAYFKEEFDEGLPADFAFRRLYKRLVSTL